MGCGYPFPQCPGTLDLLGTNFASSSDQGKLYLIEQAMGRVMVSQRSQTGVNENQRAQLKDLQELHAYFTAKINTQDNGETFFVGVGLW